ncbi:MAG: hypothetical protein AB7G06_03095 [Bdellovibrionales bacterium]
MRTKVKFGGLALAAWAVFAPATTRAQALPQGLTEESLEQVIDHLVQPIPDIITISGRCDMPRDALAEPAFVPDTLSEQRLATVDHARYSDIEPLFCSPPSHMANREAGIVVFIDGHDERVARRMRLYTPGFQPDVAHVRQIHIWHETGHMMFAGFDPETVLVFTNDMRVGFRMGIPPVPAFVEAYQQEVAGDAFMNCAGAAHMRGDDWVTYQTTLDAYYNYRVGREEDLVHATHGYLSPAFLQNLRSQCSQMNLTGDEAADNELIARQTARALLLGPWQALLQPPQAG